MQSVLIAKPWTSNGKGYTPTKVGGQQETPKIPITNVLLKLLVWAGKRTLANKMALYTTILPRVDAIQATQAWCVLFATKGII